ncbi:hypothetical protein GQ53DRAFT_741195 [Thozetella sp. PMI_491]|nr:hypothetical protein GQ53DRAFT_741195 [Thozetella sp. PMI_491]
MDQSDPAPPSDHESDWETADEEPPDAPRHKPTGPATPAPPPPLPDDHRMLARSFARGTIQRRGAISVPGTHDTLLDTIAHPVPVVRGRPVTPPPAPVPRPRPRPRRPPSSMPRRVEAQNPDEPVPFYVAARRWVAARGQRLWAFLRMHRQAIFGCLIILICVLVPVLLIIYFANPKNRPDTSWQDCVDGFSFIGKLCLGAIGSQLLVRKGSAAFAELVSPYEEFRRLWNNRFILLLVEWIPYFALTPLSNFGIRLALGPLCNSNNRMEKYFPIKKRSDLRAILEILTRYTSSNFQMSMAARSFMDLKPTIGQLLAVGLSSCAFALLEALRGPIWMMETLWVVWFPVLAASLAMRIATTCHRLGRVGADLDWEYGVGLIVYTWLISLAWEHRDDKGVGECW